MKQLFLLETLPPSSPPNFSPSPSLSVSDNFFGRKPNTRTKTKVTIALRGAQDTRRLSSAVYLDHFAVSVPQEHTRPSEYS